MSDFDGIFGGLHEGGVHKDGSKRHTTQIMGPLTAKYDLIAGICGETETTMYVPSSEWARFAAEVETFTKEINPENFFALRMRNLTIVNFGSDDQEACNRKNAPEARDFQNRRQRLISGRVS